MEETGSRRYLLLRVIESETFGNGYTRGVVAWNVQFATMFGSVFLFISGSRASYLCSSRFIRNVPFLRINLFLLWNIMRLGRLYSIVILEKLFIPQF